ncbi:hypothetical protein GCM10027289_05940 [Tsukamurella serpentis]
MADPAGDSAEEFLTAATRLFETARPWLSAGLAEHSAHPDGVPGACRLCALNGAVARHLEPFASEATKSLGQFADELLADLLALAEELLGSARVAFAAMAADYFATVGEQGRTDTGQRSPAPHVPRQEQPDGSQATGYERIDIRVQDGVQDGL